MSTQPGSLFFVFRWGMPVPVVGFHVQPRKVLNVAFENRGRVFLWLVQTFFMSVHSPVRGLA